MAKLADAADLKSAGPYRPWGFKSPSGHHSNGNICMDFTGFFAASHCCGDFQILGYEG